ncbi:acetyl/propionyl/methylcrotonyl-CoA carboxylase subunit alpha [Thalassotalea sp. HSM 43]|uniref:acetyl/propionyl/methylcrotonyl-CoA carboxylase subunit alpha n=1 Tax=Thalassotalea sp. HSM 43 TaxID=2552945 RepID=UPI00107FE704|nr:acetyl/propionyl/methylcrotonyl-CoA carboxylase subunit alpha [Thalassotalea sp. HSM 43]QBY05446.1 acetyl/propionyl/methylcrotonyl-CoA carboxylase subunit alpha [Thalassotalea sp. HSM 43]
MFKKILIANRGEIACRVIRTAREMGILTVAVYSDADRDSLHVNMADEAVYIGKAPSRESYLQADKVIAAAKQTGAQAIHPGYGFLSENSEFCRMCEDNNITFIGPPVAAIEAMGSKSAAKQIMEKANVPLVPGYHGDDQSEAIIKAASDDMGYPVLLKATAGGGGKGMRQVWSESEFSEGLAAAKREAMSSFGDDTMLVEKYLTQPRHVEIQVFCDNHDNAVYLFERDCSVQRRHQKVIEEAPAPGMSEELRAQMGDAAIQAAKAIGYQGAGTVEFLLDVDHSFYFMEMNTRLQVEHPVTEKITGQDLVEWQLRVAANEQLPLTQQQLRINGHSFEARIYAEDADNDFLPATGHLSFLQTPLESEYVRVDTGVRQGDDVSVFYDPMIAKLIVWDENRDKALQRLQKALMEYRIKGVTTNIDFLYNLATCKPFVEQDLDTGFIDKHSELIFHKSDKAIESELPVAALFLQLQQQQLSQQNNNQDDPTSPWNNSNGWRLNEANINRFSLDFNEQSYPVTVDIRGEGHATHYVIKVADQQVDAQGYIDGDSLQVIINGHQRRFSIAENDAQFSLYFDAGVIHFSRTPVDYGDAGDDQGQGGLTAPMNGTMVTLLVEPGATVNKDQPLLIMEAMKMEHTIKAPSDGVVDEFYFTAGDMVDGGAELLAFSATE